MLIIDLEDTLIAPRFLDVARWLGAPDESERRYKDRRSLADDFLSIYNERRRSDVSVERFLIEVDQLWIAWQFDDLLWELRESSDDAKAITTESPEEYKKLYKSKVKRRLALLVDVILATNKKRAV